MCAWLVNQLRCEIPYPRQVKDPKQVVGKTLSNILWFGCSRSCVVDERRTSFSVVDDDFVRGDDFRLRTAGNRNTNSYSFFDISYISMIERDQTKLAVSIMSWRDFTALEDFSNENSESDSLKWKCLRILSDMWEYYHITIAPKIWNFLIYTCRNWTIREFLYRTRTNKNNSPIEDPRRIPIKTSLQWCL